VNAVPDADVPDAGPAASPRPRLLTVAVAVVFAEAAALAVGGGVLVLDVLRGRAEYLGSTLGIALFAWVLAALLGGAARALARGRRWGRGPVLTWQVLQGAVGFLQLPGLPWFAGALVASALLVVVGLLAPASIAATAGAGTPVDGDDATGG
jgi:hypothetical protein